METSDKTETNGVAHAILPENTVTIIVKAGGKIYSQGANIGNIEAGIPDEDLDATLRAVRGLCLNLLRTIAVQLGGKPEEYPLPNIDAEQDDGPEIIMMLADDDIKAGDPVVVDVELGRARLATPDEVEVKSTDTKSE